MRTIRRMILASVLAATASIPTTAADNDTAPGQSVKADKLSNEGLKAMLDSLGYEVKEIKSTNGNAMYTIQVPVQKGSVTFYVSLSNDKNVLWVLVGIDELKPEHKADAALLLKLLALPRNMGQARLTFSPSNNYLYLDAPLANRGVSPRVLRGHIEEMVTNIDDNLKELALPKPASAQR